MDTTTPHPNQHPIDTQLAAAMTALTAGDLLTLMAIEDQLSDADRAAMLERVVAELTRRACGAGFDDDGAPVDFRVSATSTAEADAYWCSVAVRGMEIQRDAAGAEIGREVDGLVLEQLADYAPQPLTPATADSWLRDGGYLRTTEWTTHTTASGRTVLRADAIAALP